MLLVVAVWFRGNHKALGGYASRLTVPVSNFPRDYVQTDDASVAPADTAMAADSVVVAAAPSVAAEDCSAVDKNIATIAVAAGGLCRHTYRDYYCLGLRRHDLRRYFGFDVPRRALTDPLVKQEAYPLRSKEGLREGGEEGRRNAPSLHPILPLTLSKQRY